MEPLGDDYEHVLRPRPSQCKDSTTTALLCVSRYWQCAPVTVWLQLSAEASWIEECHFTSPGRLRGIFGATCRRDSEEAGNLRRHEQTHHTYCRRRSL
jgi:hypothetical protein